MEEEKVFLRNVIGEYMAELGKKNDKVVVVNADLMGTCRNKVFVEDFPNRSFNVGIAEQNMVSFAAGLAHEGFIPYAFTMAPFMSMRACEQVRTDVAYARLPVRLMATYAGLSGGISGATHWAVEDCAIMTGIPEMTVVEVCDENQAKVVLDFSLGYDNPLYIRSSVEPVRNVYPSDYKFELGKASALKEGTDGTFICSGVVVQYALEAAKIIEEKYGKHIQVIDMATIKPLDKNAVIEASKTKNIIVAQDHNIIGGLGSAVATVLAEEGLGVKFKIMGLTDKFVEMAHAPYLYHKFEYDTEGLVENMMQFFSIKDFMGGYNCRVVYNDTYIFNKTLCASSFAEVA